MLVKGHTQRGRRKPFTVIELMVAIAIMGIVMAMTLPALGRWIGGGGVSSGGSAVSGQIRFVRAFALSKRQYVALIIPDNTSLSKDNDNIYRCARPAVVTRPRNSESEPFEFLNWVEDHSWNFMPNKVYLQVDPRHESDYPEVVDVDLKGLEGSEQSSCLAVVFAPSGRPVMKGGKNFFNPAKIVVGEGYWDDTKINDKSAPDNKVYVWINQNTGRVDVVDL